MGTPQDIITTKIGPLVYNNFCRPFYVGLNSDPNEIVEDAVVFVNNEVYKNHGGELNTKSENDFRRRMFAAVSTVQSGLTDSTGGDAPQAKIKITIIIKNKSITIIIEF